MALDNTNCRWTYQPNGVSTSFAFDNLVLDAADLAVTWYASDGTELDLPSYSVTGIGIETGGNVVFATAPATVAGSLLVLERRTSSLMGSRFGDYLQDSAPVQQKRFDRAFALLQEARDAQGRSIVASPMEATTDFHLPPPSLRAGKALLFGPLPDALPVVGQPLASGDLVVSAFVEQLLDDADASTFLTSLGFSAFIKSVRATVSADALLEALGFTPYFRGTLLELTDGASWRDELTQAPSPIPVLLFDNAACQVKQQSGTTNLSTSPQHAKVDRFSAWASGGTVGAGTIGQNTASDLGRTGTSLHLAGVTLTGSGKLSIRQRLEAQQARQVRNATVSLGVAVRHDCDAAVNFTVRLSKADAADNFSAVTFIAASSAQSIAPNTNGRVVFENVALGDVANGLEVLIEADCGAITTKNFEFTEFAAAIATAAPAYAPLRAYADELLACMRFWQDGSWSYNEAYVSGSWTLPTQVPFRVKMRAVPTCTVSVGSLGTAYLDGVVCSTPVSVTVFHSPFTWTADARFAP